MRILGILAVLLLFATEASAQTWTKVADEGQSYTLTAPAQVRYGAGTAWLTLDRGAGTHGCNHNGLPDPAPGVFKRCDVAGTVAGDKCWVLNPFAYRIEDVPATVSPAPTKAAVWLGDCNPASVEVQLFSELELLNAFNAIRQTGFSRDAANAYRRSQPVTLYTAAEKAYIAGLKAKYAVTFGLVPATPPAPTWVVRQISGGTRPYYEPNATLKGIGKKRGDVATLTACDQSKRLGATSYYFVPSVGFYAVCAAP